MYASCTLHYAFVLMQPTQGLTSPFLPDFLRKQASNKSDIRYSAQRKPNKGLKGKGDLVPRPSGRGGTCNFSLIPFPPHLHNMYVVYPEFLHVFRTCEKSRRCGRKR
ncbi:hypothetical protein TWF173_010785, partial [Orbilia oligospora]